MVTSKNLSCDWLTRFMKVILLGLSLVRTSLQYRCAETGLQYKRTAVQLIQAQCVQHKCVQIVSSLKVVYSCVQQYSKSVHESIYIKCNVCVHVCPVYVSVVFTEVQYICISCVQQYSISVHESIYIKCHVCPVYMNKKGTWAWDF